jgi:hypothetical protein
LARLQALRGKVDYNLIYRQINQKTQVLVFKLQQYWRVTLQQKAAPMDLQPNYSKPTKQNKTKQNKQTTSKSIKLQSKSTAKLPRSNTSNVDMRTKEANGGRSTRDVGAKSRQKRVLRVFRRLSRNLRVFVRVVVVVGV